MKKVISALMFCFTAALVFASTPTISERGSPNTLQVEQLIADAPVVDVNDYKLVAFAPDVEDEEQVVSVVPLQPAILNRLFAETPETLPDKRQRYYSRKFSINSELTTQYLKEAHRCFNCATGYLCV